MCTTPSRPIRLLAAMLLPVALVAGCSKASASDAALDKKVEAYIASQAAPARAMGAPLQAKALEDGVVTDEEYRTLFAGFERCMVKRGTPVSEKMLSPVDGRTMLWGVDWKKYPKNEGDGIQHECTHKYVSIVAGMVGELPKPMEPDLRDRTVACLRAKGEHIKGSSKDIRAIWWDATKNRRPVNQRRDPVSACLSEGFSKLYPEQRDIFSWVPPTRY